MSKIDLSLILPCFNEGPTFESSVDRIYKELAKLKKDFEIIFVDDKSTDGTAKKLTRLLKATKNSRVIFHKKNLGRGKTVEDGIKVARGKFCGYIDVDLEVSESYIPIFVNELEKGADLVVGKRFYEGGSGAIIRYLASKTYSILVKNILDIPIEDTETGYKFFNRKKILPVIAKIRDKHWFWDTEICAWSYKVNLKISEVPVLFIRRRDKKSTVKLIPDTYQYIKNLITFRKRFVK